MKLTAFLLLALSAAATVVGCAETQKDQQITVIKEPEKEAPKGGIPPDKMAEIQQTFDVHNSSMNKCYNDVLGEKHTRTFQGTILVLVSLEPGAGENAKVTAVKFLKDGLGSKDVTDCLSETIKGWDFPQVPAKGDIEKQLSFRPAY